MTAPAPQPYAHRTRPREQDATDLEEMLIGLESARYEAYFGARDADAEDVDANGDECED